MLAFLCHVSLLADINSTLSPLSAGTTTEASPPAPPPPEAQPIETKAPEEEMDVTDDDITAGRKMRYGVQAKAVDLEAEIPALLYITYCILCGA